MPTVKTLKLNNSSKPTLQLTQKNLPTLKITPNKVMNPRFIEVRKLASSKAGKKTA